MILRRILFKPPGLFMRNWSNSQLQYRQAAKDFSRLKIEVKPKDNISRILYTVCIKHPKYDEGRSRMFLGHIIDKTVNICFQQTDLIKDQLHLELFLVFVDETKIDTIPFMIDSLKQYNEVKLKTGFKEVDIITTITKDLDVRFRKATELCRKENEFVDKRKRFVFDKMKTDFGSKAPLEVKDVPNIAIIGSGGGMRAVIGMCGAICALENIGILDYTMYTAGLSGSAWYLSTLYAYDEKVNPQLVRCAIQHTLKHFSVWEILKCQYMVGKRVQSHIPEYRWWKFLNNLTFKFGSHIGVSLLNEKSLSKWSKQTNKLEDGSVPLPLLTVLHVRDQIPIDEYHEWIELSPYEVFIQKYGAAIDMDKFGDKFYGGFVTEKHMEKPISFIQGLCGSGYAIVKNWKPTERGWIMPFSYIKNSIRALFLHYFDQKSIGSVYNWLYGMKTHEQLRDDIGSINDLTDRKQKQMLLVDAGLALNSPYPSVLQSSRKVDVIISLDFSDRKRDRNWPFEELEKAARWAKNKSIPFPEIDSKLEEIRKKCFKHGDYKEVYIFPGGCNSPTIVHFVMINNAYATSGLIGASDFRILPDYKTTRFHYSSKEFDKLFDLIRYNVDTNKKMILDGIFFEIEKKR